MTQFSYSNFVWIYLAVTAVYIFYKVRFLLLYNMPLSQS
jgi:hypothetical protein